MTPLLEWVNAYIEVYEEIENVAETILENEYSKGWYYELKDAQRKLEALRKFKAELTK